MRQAGAGCGARAIGRRDGMIARPHCPMKWGGGCSSGWRWCGCRRARFSMRVAPRGDYPPARAALSAGAPARHGCAPAMVREARAALPAIRRVLSGLAGTAPRWLAGDIDSLPVASRRFALAWSNLVLHWLPDPAAAFAENAAHARSRGLLMFSTLGPDTLKNCGRPSRRRTVGRTCTAFPTCTISATSWCNAGFAGSGNGHGDHHAHLPVGGCDAA